MMCCYLNVQFQGQRVIELKTAIPAYTRNISQADLQKMFANKRVQVYTLFTHQQMHHLLNLEKFKFILKCT